MSTSNLLEKDALGTAAIQRKTVSSIKHRLAGLEVESRQVGLPFVAHLIGIAEVSCGEVEAAWQEFLSAEDVPAAVKSADEEK